MPRDEDEDLSAPLDLGSTAPAPPRAKAGAARPAAAAKPTPSAAPSWGLCGVMHQFGELVGFPGSSGVVRFVTSGVQYSTPPIAVRWRPVPSEPGRFEFPWEGDPAAARSLRSLRSDLERAARAGKLNDPDHPLLRELDEVSIALVSLASQLQQGRWSLGLVQPDGVYIKGKKEGTRAVVLADLGFSWKGSYGEPPWEDSPGRPDWLEALSANRWLWDYDPVRQQFSDPENGVYSPSPPVADVRTLGRLFAWLLSGQTSKDVPMVGGADGPPPAWATVADAAAGRIPNADALAGRLRAAPLSEYFAPMSMMAEEKPRKSGMGLILVSLFMLLLGGGAGAAWYFLRDKPVETASGGGGESEKKEPEKKEPEKKEPEKKEPENKAPVKKEPLDENKFDAAIKQFDEARENGDIKGMFAALPGLAEHAPAEKKAEYESRRTKAIEAWTAQVNAAIKLGADPSRRLDVSARLDELESQLKALTQDYPATDPDQQLKEQQCLEYVATFARQFGPPR